MQTPKPSNKVPSMQNPKRFVLKLIGQQIYKQKDNLLNGILIRENGRLYYLTPETAANTTNCYRQAPTQPFQPPDTTETHHRDGKHTRERRGRVYTSI